eukprot:6197712-Pleurochrysis_carterae.AAC.2
MKYTEKQHDLRPFIIFLYPLSDSLQRVRKGKQWRRGGRGGGQPLAGWHPCDAGPSASQHASAALAPAVLAAAKLAASSRTDVRPSQVKLGFNCSFSVMSRIHSEISA